LSCPQPVAGIYFSRLRHSVGPGDGAIARRTNAKRSIAASRTLHTARRTVAARCAASISAAFPLHITLALATAPPSHAAPLLFATPLTRGNPRSTSAAAAGRSNVGMRASAFFSDPAGMHVRVSMRECARASVCARVRVVQQRQCTCVRVGAGAGAAGSAHGACVCDMRPRRRTVRPRRRVSIRWRVL
jgi:hypothetical protein